MKKAKTKKQIKQFKTVNIDSKAHAKLKSYASRKRRKLCEVVEDALRIYLRNKEENVRL